MIAASAMGDTHTHVADPAALFRRGYPVGASEPHLRAVLEETLANPGSLTRLRLALLAGEVLGLGARPTQALACALEYFHTASLLFDDLPCMDDARQRRGAACAHLRHGEAAAILGALGFINRGYALIWQALEQVPAAQRGAVAAHVEHCLGDAGVLNGQSLDLHFAASDGSPRAVARAAIGKTVALMRLTLVTPALMAGARPREQMLLHRLSVYWGLAYQAADDCADLTTGTDPSAKTAGRDRARGHPNFAVAAGADQTGVHLERLLTLVGRTWAQLLALRAGWHALAPLIVKLNQAILAATAALPEAAGVRRCA